MTTPKLTCGRILEKYYGVSTKNFCHAKQILIVKGVGGGEGGLNELVKKKNGLFSM